MLWKSLQRLVRVRWLAAFLLAVAVVAPYHQLISGRVIPIPDDIFVSDLADGEFPQRVEAGRIARNGEVPIWTPGVLTGAPLIVDPLSVALFTLLPPALALGCLIGLLLVAAAVGTYILARQSGASRSGAFLAGFAFAWSGFFVCQMRHLTIIGTVALFPWALYCLERAATGSRADSALGRTLSQRERFVWLNAFGAVFGLQVLFAFPQSAYISALVYAALVASRMCWLFRVGDRNTSRGRRVMTPAAYAFGALAAVAVGTLVGMVIVMPLWELGGLSDRQGGLQWEWATRINYDLPMWKTFFAPYSNGDISDLSYRGKGLFWEDYGYVGLATLLIAMLAIGIRMKRFAFDRFRPSPAAPLVKDNAFAVVFWACVTLLSFGIVVGPATPLYGLAFHCLPGLSTFRFATRFLFLVDLGLALLGAFGLTFLQQHLSLRVPPERRRVFPFAFGVLIAAVTVADLLIYNNRQNPFTEAGRWLAPPPTASLIQSIGDDGRVYAPNAKQQHKLAFFTAQGWSGDLTPFYEQRDLLQPNSNLLRGLSTLDGYVSLSPAWTVDLIGDHNREGLINAMNRVDPGEFRTHANFYDWIEVLNVRWLILPLSVTNDRLENVGRSASNFVYRVKGTMPRARIAPRLRLVPTMEEVWSLTKSAKLEPRNEVLMHTAEDVRRVVSLQSGPQDEPTVGEASIVINRATEVVVDAKVPRGGLLILADTYYPGWRASVDGRETPVMRVNIAQRGVALPPGRHRVTFAYSPSSFRRGLALTCLGLVLFFCFALVLSRMRPKV